MVAEMRCTSETGEEVSGVRVQTANFTSSLTADIKFAQPLAISEPVFAHPSSEGLCCQHAVTTV